MINVICLSNQVWDFPNWTNKRHVMSRIAGLGNNVLFVDPPINTGRMFAHQVLKGQWGAKRLLTQKYRDDGVLIYSPLNLIPNGELTSLLHAQRIVALAKKNLDPTLKNVLWVYHVEIPGLQSYIDLISHDTLVYDCVDNYGAFPENSSFYSATIGRDQIIKQERSLAEQADVVFATTPGLVEKLSKYNSSVHFAPNVGDYKRFKDVQELKQAQDQIPEDLQAIPRPRIGFIGALDSYKFDATLVRKAAIDHPNYSFVLIGQFALKEKDAGLEALGLADLPNIYYLGPRPYEQKKYYMAGLDVELIPYQLNDYTVGGCFPVKFHDALAAGLPTVVTDLPTYAPFKDVTYIAKSPEDFSAKIELALKEDDKEKIKARQAVAKENDWDGKVAKMLAIITQ
ncbi:hypothetical protein A2886_00815 [candidate division WWE3 bacterium RIFCSPHIGHO2_01_FULL_42_13]|uniref:Glycosyl transferase family 1 domain-containing protein n=1 Tax=candidate division WWE3 bacterium RIFCSPHIGHO2_01_FULL_42_13 TaxID=1802617 RepID=A0A1F4UQK3_UNCKA|nr:MAG: hypothetical protein A2886_00815 [candidate division WWE3 bacterium RIFCSPHIGHO2_01_FULL_42_13]